MAYPNYCYVTRDKETKEEFLIPVCWSVALCHSSLSPRQIIKEYCTCERPAKKSFDVKEAKVERCEMFKMLHDLEGNISKMQTKIKAAVEELEMLKEEFDVLKTAYCTEIIDEDLSELLTNTI